MRQFKSCILHLSFERKITLKKISKSLELRKPSQKQLSIKTNDTDIYHKSHKVAAKYSIKAA